MLEVLGYAKAEIKEMMDKQSDKEKWPDMQKSI